MNAVEYSINVIRQNIPREILEIGFLTRDDVSNKYLSLDEKIIHNVFNKRIKIDLNLLGGVDTVVPLRSCQVSRIPRRNTFDDFLIRVPKELTSGRSIINVLKLSAAVWNREDTSYIGNFHCNTIMQSAAKMLGNVDNTSVIQTSKLELVGENTILCTDPGYPLLSTQLHIQIENQENLENIRRPHYIYIGNLAVLATKMYIWTNLSINLNKGQIYGGHELSVIKDQIDEYREAAERYQEELKRWPAICVANSKMKMNKYLSLLIGNNI